MLRSNEINSDQEDNSASGTYVEYSINTTCDKPRRLLYIC